MTARNTLAFARLEFAEALRSKWLAFTVSLYLLVAVAFVWLGLRESSLLGFTGLSRVVLNVSNAVVIAFPLVVLAATSQVVVRARTTGFFELLLVQPVRPSEWFVGVVACRVLVLVGPLLLGFLAVGLASHVVGAERNLAVVSARCMAVSMSLIWAFIGIGLLLSSLAKTAERAMVYALGAWVVTTALHDFALIGVLLHTRIPPHVVFALAAVNPVEAARIGILTSVDPELSVLGPVGFWLANTLGPRVSLAVAVGWPLLVGTVTTLLASARLVRSDRVG